ncbi:hypothetical protein [Sulfoacidibacillus thermotolerans]|uniref:Uncharacterized protein n=1 Tax=Sulfoacidibacillus thermotolerans TaxID=1765684 RepID=A0A2U3DBZ8_SULT2|nr:hypothetical protein [Sulfoacidibacillus thermotolerans]PWI58809.1 hypothetical protein BM613_01580 [Sulfoacidibacillus thermotolerans]
MTLGEVIMALWVYSMALVVAFSSMMTSLHGMELAQSTSTGMYVCQGQLETACRELSIGERPEPLKRITLNGVSFVSQIDVETIGINLVKVRSVIYFLQLGREQKISFETLQTL